MSAFDVVVIGGGPGGYVAAIRAAQLGKKTAVVEKEHLGGICLNWGCIPTKALLRSAEVLRSIKESEDYGVETTGSKIHLDKMVARSRKIAQGLNQGVGYLLKKNKVTVFEGQATVKSNKDVVVSAEDGSQKTISAAHVIIATGARAKQLPGLESDKNLIWTYREAMTPKKLPKSLLVMGAGAIGIEFASFYNELGVDVTVVEFQDRILPVEDREISEFALKSFQKQGIKVMTSSKVASITKQSDQIVAEIESAGKTQKITFERAISAVGVVPNVEGLGLDKTSVSLTKNGFIKVNEYLQTEHAGIYAIGDVAGPPCLAHKASHEGVICVENIFTDHNETLDFNLIPGCTYSHPQVASIGFTEDKALEKGHKINVGRFPLSANGKAIAQGDAHGIIKTIFDQDTGELLGAHMVGPEVTEMIQGFGIAKKLESTEQELIETVFAHPTISESMHESILDSLGRAIHF